MIVICASIDLTKKEREGECATCDTISSILHLHHHELIHTLKGKFHNVFLVYCQRPS